MGRFIRQPVFYEATSATQIKVRGDTPIAREKLPYGTNNYRYYENKMWTIDLSDPTDVTPVL